MLVLRDTVVQQDTTNERVNLFQSYIDIDIVNIEWKSSIAILQVQLELSTRPYFPSLEHWLHIKQSHRYVKTRALSPTSLPAPYAEPSNCRVTASRYNRSAFITLLQSLPCMVGVSPASTTLPYIDLPCMADVHEPCILPSRPARNLHLGPRSSRPVF
jgi:hypothetical protein